ncbi:MAG: N4-gp56 family major capsid protein [Firmicutes bacterium]|nr:N4-gp56 family major capsid protein [Bacillota bacterium]
MTTNTQTYNDVNQNQLSTEAGEFYQRAMLQTLKDKVCFLPYGKAAMIPRNAGATTSWRVLTLPGLATTAITEGTTPDGVDLSISKVSATVSQYGAWTKLSDYIDLVGLDPLLTDVAQMFGEHAALSIDKIIATVLSGTTNTMMAGGKANKAALTAEDTLTAADIIAARNKLVSNNVPMLRLPNGSMGYVAFTHPNCIKALMSEANGPWAAFNGGTEGGLAAFQKGEIGQMYGIHFIETTTLGGFTDGGSGGLAGKNTVIIGADAFGIPDIEGSSKPEILVFGEGNTENPMALYKTVAWKACFAAAILDEKKVLLLQSID